MMTLKKTQSHRFKVNKDKGFRDMMTLMTKMTSMCQKGPRVLQKKYNNRHLRGERTER